MVSVKFPNLKWQKKKSWNYIKYTIATYFFFFFSFFLTNKPDGGWINQILLCLSTFEMGELVKSVFSAITSIIKEVRVAPCFHEYLLLRY